MNLRPNQSGSMGQIPPPIAPLLQFPVEIGQDRVVPQDTLLVIQDVVILPADLHVLHVSTEHFESDEKAVALAPGHVGVVESVEQQQGVVIASAWKRALCST